MARNPRVQLRSDRIQALMIALDMDSVGLAYRAGISYDYVYKILRGERPNISAINLAAIAYALGVSMEYLMGLADKPEIARLFEEGTMLNVSEDNQRWLVNMASRLASMAREIDNAPVENQGIVRDFVANQIQQMHKVVDTTAELGRILASYK